MKKRNVNVLYIDGYTNDSYDDRTFHFIQETPPLIRQLQKVLYDRTSHFILETPPLLVIR